MLTARLDALFEVKTCDTNPEKHSFQWQTLVRALYRQVGCQDAASRSIHYFLGGIFAATGPATAALMPSVLLPRCSDHVSHGWWFC
jgi:hypothetical protein